MKRKKGRHQEKAKSQAKAKAKGKPKAASTRRKQKEKKETKDTKEKNEEEDAPKRENLNDKCTCEKLRAAVGDAETQQDQQDVSEEEGELRDRGKARKFQKLKDAGPIPDQHSGYVWAWITKKQDKPRSYKTALINRLFKSDVKGGYESSVLASQFLNPKTHLVLQARGQHECAQDFGTIMLQRD